MADVYQISYDGQINWIDQQEGFNSIPAPLSELAQNGLYERTVRDGCVGPSQLVPNPPVVNDGTLNVTEGTSTVLDLTSIPTYDPFNGSLTYTVIVAPIVGSASISGSDLTYSASTVGVSGPYTMTLRATTARGEFADFIVTANIAAAAGSTSPVINGVSNQGSPLRAVVDTCGSTGTQIQAGIDIGNTGNIDFLKIPQNNSGCDFIELSSQGAFYEANTGDRIIVRTSNNNFVNFDEATFIVP